MPRRTTHSAPLFLIKADRIARRLWPGLVPPLWWQSGNHLHSVWPDGPTRGRLYEVAVPVLHRPRRGLHLSLGTLASARGDRVQRYYSRLTASLGYRQIASETSGGAPSRRPADGR